PQAGAQAPARERQGRERQARGGGCGVVCSGLNDRVQRFPIRKALCSLTCAGNRRSAMTALTDFHHSIASARSLISMYAELRRSRGLGQRGRLSPENEDLLWLPRAAVVTALSSLDAYVHAVLHDQIPQALQR